MKDWLEFFGTIGIVILLVFAAIMIVCATPIAVNWAKTLFISEYWTHVSIAIVGVSMLVSVAILIGGALFLLFDYL